MRARNEPKETSARGRGPRTPGAGRVPFPFSDSPATQHRGLGRGRKRKEPKASCRVGCGVAVPCYLYYPSLALLTCHTVPPPPPPPACGACVRSWPAGLGRRSTRPSRAAVRLRVVLRAPPCRSLPLRRRRRPPRTDTDTCSSGCLDHARTVQTSTDTGASATGDMSHVCMGT